MLIVDLNYSGNLKQIDQYLIAHREFLQKYYDQGVLLASGPKQPRDGGIIIALVDEATMRTIITEDPFYQQGIAEYKFISFEPVKYSQVLAPLLEP
jgi:uncharacterized protein YciI